jgi:O-methyltransferase involved in polyketide biosynthesis
MICARETKGENPILHDKWAVELCQEIQLDEREFQQAQVSDEVQPSLLLRRRHYDQIVETFLIIHPLAPVVCQGCGLDAHFECLDNGTFPGRTLTCQR